MKRRYKAPRLEWRNVRRGRVSVASIGGGMDVAATMRHCRWWLSLHSRNMPGAWAGPSYATLYAAKRGAARWLVALGMV